MVEYSLLPKAKESSFKKTSFTQILTSKGWNKTNRLPGVYDNVVWLGYDEEYGDLFKTWNNDKKGFTIFSGIKGDEF